MRRLLSVPILGVALLAGALVIPGARAAAEKPAAVQVTNVPLPVTVGNFPPSPRPFAGRETYIVPEGTFGVSGGGTFVAPPSSVIETISAHVLVPAGQKPLATMLLADDTGRIVGSLRVPLQFQADGPAGDEYVGTITNARAPMGATPAGQPVNFEISRNATAGIAIANITVIGLPAGQQ